MDLYFTPDVSIPVEYATPSGSTTSYTCAVHVQAVDGKSAAPLVSWMQAHDWSDFGRKVAQEAEAHPFVPDDQYDDPWTAEGIATQSFVEAMQRVLMQELPADLFPEEYTLHISSDFGGPRS